MALLNPLGTIGAARLCSTPLHSRPAIFRTDCFPYRLGPVRAAIPWRLIELASDDGDVVMVVATMMTVVRFCKGSNR
jgi:hypothetical protein